MTERICPYCHKPFDEPHQFKICNACRERHKENDDKRRSAASLTEVCTRCLKPFKSEQFKTCDACRKHQQGYRKKTPEKTKGYTIKRREKFHKYLRNYSRKNRLLVLQHYSHSDVPYCSCCGENVLEFLTIDHSNGDGAEHRRKEKITAGGGTYGWIIRNNFPDNIGLRVLCYNCNASIGFNGYCPHQKEFLPKDGAEKVL